MLNQEEIDWYEENWAMGKNGRDAISHSRSWKLYLNIWDFDDGNQNKYKSDYNCWKRHRKTHYRIRDVRPKKVRKPKEREYWRYKKPYHSHSYTWAVYKSSIREKKTNILLNEFFNDVFVGDMLIDGRGISWRVIHRSYSGQSLCFNLQYFMDTQSVFNARDRDRTIVGAFVDDLSRMGFVERVYHLDDIYHEISLNWR